MRRQRNCGITCRMRNVVSQWQQQPRRWASVCVTLVLVFGFVFVFGLWSLFASVWLPRWLANRASYWLTAKGAKRQLYFERTTTSSKFFFFYIIYLNYLVYLFIYFFVLFWSALLWNDLFYFFFINLPAVAEVIYQLLRHCLLLHWIENLIFLLFNFDFFFFSFLFCYPSF